MSLKRNHNENQHCKLETSHVALQENFDRWFAKIFSTGQLIGAKCT